jgi:hypothetical protein
VGPEPVTFEIEVVDRGDHAHPVQLDQGPHQRCQPQQLVARFRAEPHHATAGSVQRRQRDRRPPVDVVEERPMLRADHLEQPDRIAGERALHLVDAAVELLGMVGLERPERPVAVRRPSSITCRSRSATRAPSERTPSRGSAVIAAPADS